MKLYMSPDFSNSPQKELIKHMTILFSSYEVEKVMEFIDEEITWTLVGDDPIYGKDSFAKALNEMSENKASELSIYQIVTQGKEGAVHGEMKMQNGEVYGFADFYEFRSAGADKVKSITSYVIPKT